MGYKIIESTDQLALHFLKLKNKSMPHQIHLNGIQLNTVNQTRQTVYTI